MDTYKIEWLDYLADINKLVDKIKNIKPVRPFTDIVAISRGGLIPAGLIAYKLDIKRVHSFGISMYSDKNILMRNPIIYQNLPTFPSNSSILVIDEIVDSGKTLTVINQEFTNRGICRAQVIYASVYIKNKDQHIIKCDVYDKELLTTDWVSLPYD
jgi:hypoxanthine phosphoribosyltransferase